MLGERAREGKRENRDSCFSISSSATLKELAQGLRTLASLATLPSFEASTALENIDKMPQLTAGLPRRADLRPQGAIASYAMVRCSFSQWPRRVLPIQHRPPPSGATDCFYCCNNDSEQTARNERNWQGLVSNSAWFR